MKYYNFFLDNFITAFSFFGNEINANSLNIILPVGISFYTFQTLSYSIDVYRRKLEPSTDFIAFSAFVCFFPQLVAGPIERATNLLPPFNTKRVFDNNKAIDGIHLILWGLFKKIVIADSCAVYANEIFSNYENMNSLSLMLGAVYFSFQIYGDFSGYSDIAIGTSKLFGIDLMKNFRYPYFSRDIRGSVTKKIRNVFIIFLVSGFWHGANWTFIIWGGLNALYFLPLLLAKKNRNYIDTVAEGKILPTFREFTFMLMTYSLTVVAWIFFRADSVTVAVKYIESMLSFNFKNGMQYLSSDRYVPELMILIFFFILVEWNSREKDHPFFGKWIYLKISLTLLALITLGVYSNISDFIYFQF